jgi:hypothetical protein
MKRGFRGFGGRSLGAEVVLVAVLLLLLFPNSTSVLCIASGSHIAIEDINENCCASTIIPDQAVSHAQSELGLTGNCGDCTDVFMTLFGREAIPKSHCYAACSSQVGECLRNQLPAELSLSQFHQHAIGSIDRLNPSSSSLPLRC